MKYCYGKININPTSPALPIGFEVVKEKISSTKLDLDLRLLRLVEDETDITLITIDSLFVSADIYMIFKDLIKNYWRKTEVNISASHSHFAPSLCNQFPLYQVNEVYLNYVKKQLEVLLSTLQLKELDGYIDYHYISFNKVGKSRIIDAIDENVYASVMSFFDNQTRIGSFLFYNCHPTINSESSDHFSSDYVGYVTQKFEKNNPKEFFMFMQGACGDISTRFVRKEKTMNEVVRLSEQLYKCFDKLLAKNKPLNKLKLSFKKESYRFPYSVKQVDQIDQNYLESLDPREAGEILASKELVKIVSRMPNIPKNIDVYLSRLNLGKYRLVFSPFELFSSYNNQIDRKKEMLIGYTNGSLSYITPLHSEIITYEYFMEIISDSVKELIINRLLSM